MDERMFLNRVYKDLNDPADPAEFVHETAIAKTGRERQQFPQLLKRLVDFGVIDTLELTDGVCVRLTEFGRRSVMAQRGYIVRTGRVITE